MGLRNARYLAVIGTLCGMLLQFTAIPAKSLASEFTRFPLDHPVSAWYPVDINNDGTWELAITCGGTPARVGIFSPQTETWLYGPDSLPVTGSSWGAGDYDGDSVVEFAYLNADTICLHEVGAASDSTLWVAPFSPSSAVFRGASQGGRLLVGLTESRWYYSEVLVVPFIHMIDSSYSIIHVCDVLNGAESLQFLGDGRSRDDVSGLASLSGDRLAIHQHMLVVDDFFFLEIRYVDTIVLADSHWNLNPILKPGVQFSGSPPPDPAYFMHASPDPTGPRVVVDLLTLFSHRPCRISCQNISDGATVWSRSFATPYYVSFAAYDLHEDGNPALYLPLISGQGWEVRTLSLGAIKDTLFGMPIAGLQTGPLLSAGHQDLFYLADSSIYIWGVPTSVHDGQTPPANLPTTPWLTAYPNPFNGSVRLTWSPAQHTLNLEILNILGQRIRTYDLSTTSIEWDGRDDAGRTVPTGIYFARLTGSHQPVVKKLVLLK